MAVVSSPFAVLPAADLERARKFYETVLGLSPLDEESRGGIFFGMGEGRIWVYETPAAGTARNTQVGWFVDDIEAEVQRLQDAGVVFETFEMPDVTWDGPVATHEGLRSAWFKDSEGNTLCIDEAV